MRDDIYLFKDVEDTGSNKMTHGKGRAS
ncbi:hypothetical protein CFOL_v3_16917 [Cephalotus follicularis]|uniref:Uncharacterized protein n=1 Tax=Cephalotus follicularis TaxID=3775 RepID=A0A1Q3BZZ0_CEPFO|nr:hypothetical protein CFOL_v3_16917 [Cephalotus follicularis]